MNRLTSYESECKREMICRYEDCDICQEYCPHLNEDNCACLQEVLDKLAKYEDTGLTPEQIREIDRMYAEKCKELAKTKENQGWIPCSERLPEKGDFYLTTVVFEGKSSTCRHLFDTDNEEWLDSDYMPFVNDEISEIIAWKPLPDTYREEKQLVSQELMQAAREVRG